MAFLFALFAKPVFSQNCFDITNILADACGNPEQDNEMVRFRIGPNPLNVSNLNLTWPSGAFTGICQNTNTAQKVSDLNASIVLCGHLLEPVGGVLPAGSNVILVSGENMDVFANSFANLTDTIYMIFQCGTSSLAHFKNHYPTSASTGNPRTLKMDFGASCSDTVFYIPNLLVNSLGTLADTLQDGSSIAFDPNGNATYYNNGCQAPIITITATESVSADTTCPGSLVTLTAANLSGNYSSYYWAGGNGVIASPTSLSSSYQTSNTFTGTDYIQFVMVGQCNDTIRDSVAIFLQSGSAVSISGPTSVCNGNTIVLTASSSSSYLWSTGATTQTINVTLPNTYTVTATGACGTSSDNYIVTGGTTPNISVTPGINVSICTGQTVTLTANGASSYIWSTGLTSASITVNAAGVYTVSSSNACGTDSVQITVTQSNNATVNITSSNGTSLCTGSSTTLTANATGATSYAWAGGQTTSSINVTTPGSYTVTITSSCGTATATQVITPGALPVPVINASATILCPGTSITLTASGGNTYTWSTGASGNSISVTQAGTYKTFATNGCGTDSTSITINSSTVSAAFTPDPLTGFAPLAVNFTNNSISNASNSWSLGDGTTATTVNTEHTYTLAGLYTVTLLVTDNGNCSATASTVIDVKEDTTKIFIPDIVTPNGDGKNDLFAVVGSTISYTDVIIYNRWGQFITKYSRYAKGTEQGWDASNEKDGVYYYVIDIGFKNGSFKTVKGSVTVVH